MHPRTPALSHLCCADHLLQRSQRLGHCLPSKPCGGGSGGGGGQGRIIIIM